MFPSGLEDNLSKNPNIAYDQVKEVKDNLEKFYDRILEYANDKNSFIKEDLEQVFILLLLQRYRQRQVKSMSNVLFYSILVVTGLLILTLFAFIILEVPGTNSSNKILQNTNENGTLIPTCSSQSINLLNENESRHLQNISSKSLESPNANPMGNIKSIRVLS